MGITTIFKSVVGMGKSPRPPQGRGKTSAVIGNDGGSKQQSAEGIGRPGLLRAAFFRLQIKSDGVFC
jgi:hypothetical protein